MFRSGHIPNAYFIVHDFKRMKDKRLTEVFQFYYNEHFMDYPHGVGNDICVIKVRAIPAKKYETPGPKKNRQPRKKLTRF